MIGLLPVLLSYVPLTLRMAGIAMVLALALAALMAVVRVLRVPVLDQLTRLFISFFRGTPLLVQLFLFYFGLPQVMPALTAIDGVTAAVMGLTLHFSAYMAESIRAAIVGVSRSQWDAARSVGMTTAQSMRRIILPQAARVAAPTLVNYFIDMIKSTSLAFTLGVTELMGAAQKEAAGSFLYFEAFIMVALIYWAIVEALSFAQRRLGGPPQPGVRAMIRVRGLVKRYDGAAVLDGIDLDIADGERIVAIGPSGTGKSTLLRCLALLEMPDEGRIEIDGVAVEAPRIKPREAVALQAQDRLRVPGLRALRQQDRLRQRRRGADGGEGDAEARGRAPRLGAFGVDRPRRAGRLLPGRALGRAAAARGHRARDGARGLAHALRRADLGARPRVGRGGALA